MAKTNTLVKISATGKWDEQVKSSHNIREFNSFIMDEPVELGGTDEGANPMEYIAAALNGCKAVMIPLIAKEQGFTFTNLDFETTGVIDIRGLMGEEGVNPHFQKVRFTVKIETEESEEAIEKLKSEVERRCPVYNLLADANVKIDAIWKKA
ncbi:OsmC family protein [Bacillus sp. FJAT-45350]|uniref:OsmC family protein n=1 Tax=Bacillus sp. FJAT-45350 TaxID=2011014 RepID=UPI000BB8CBF5|nr:OsmC family protein [Bacillus sp. FJAT-45350]